MMNKLGIYLLTSSDSCIEMPTQNGNSNHTSESFTQHHRSTLPKSKTLQAQSFPAWCSFTSFSLSFLLFLVFQEEAEPGSPGGTSKRVPNRWVRDGVASVDQSCTEGRPWELHARVLASWHSVRCGVRPENVRDRMGRPDRISSFGSGNGKTTRFMYRRCSLLGRVAGHSTL